MSIKNILIHGYGQVGKALEGLVQNHPSFNLSGIIDRSHSVAQYKHIEAVEDFSDIDIIIDFTRAEGFINLVDHLKNQPNKPAIVTGSSGWQSKEQDIIDLIKETKMRVLYGANFSIGTALFIHLSTVAAKLYNLAGDYDVAVTDIHHRKKIDMPSGTAYRIANNILSAFDSKDELLIGSDADSVAENQLHVSAVRVGSHLGGHDVIFDSPSDIIRIQQETRTRSAYASGSLVAAKWLIQQEKAGYYTFQDFIQSSILQQINK